MRGLWKTISRIKTLYPTDLPGRERCPMDGVPGIPVISWNRSLPALSISINASRCIGISSLEMVGLRCWVQLIRVVLYFAPSNTWKIGDFGLTTDGTTNRSLTTVYGRGTASYRPPELIQEKRSFTNKVDIFAMGCILYELDNAGKKLFSDDFDVWGSYAGDKRLDKPILTFMLDIWSVDEDLLSRDKIVHFSDSLYEALAKKPSDRPSAKALRDMFGFCRYVTACAEFIRRRELKNAAEMHGFFNQYWLEVAAVRELASACLSKLGQCANGFKNGDLETVKWLVKHGVDISACDEDGGTPLCYAARNGNLETIKWLVERGADISASDIWKRTPSNHAAANGHLETVKWLVERGADISASDKMDELH